MLNGKKIPIPFPVFTIKEAFNFVEKKLLNKNQMVTKLTLNNKSLDVSFDSEDIELNESHLPYFIAESPEELCQKAFDALPNLIGLILDDIKSIAVDIWQIKEPNIVPQNLIFLLRDIRLICDLGDSALGFFMDKNSSEMIKNRLVVLSNCTEGIKEQIKSSDYKEIASILLNKIEPALEYLNVFFMQIQENIENQLKEHPQEIECP